MFKASNVELRYMCSRQGTHRVGAKMTKQRKVRILKIRKTPRRKKESLYQNYTDRSETIRSHFTQIRGVTVSISIGTPLTKIPRRLTATPIYVICMAASEQTFACALRSFKTVILMA